MIPKKIHLIWLGSKRPEKFNPLVDEIKRINYDYDIIEWNDDNINFELINQNTFEKVKNFGSKSDILRYEILFKFGGIYMDYDFIQIKKFDDLLNNKFVAGAYKTCPNEVWNGLMMTCEGSEIMKKCINNLNFDIDFLNENDNQIMDCTGPFYLRKNIEDLNDISKITYLNGDYFYPFDPLQRHIIKKLNESDIMYLKSFATEKTYCIHAHLSDWQ